MLSVLADIKPIHATFFFFIKTFNVISSYLEALRAEENVLKDGQSSEMPFLYFLN